jgi:hypothetical protein
MTKPKRRAKSKPSSNSGALVFLTWSGDRSKAVALALRHWLAKVLQNSKPWVSARDIGAGDFWDDEIRNKLASAAFGIVCATDDNVSAPWVNYEAGALAERIGGRVCPYLFGVEFHELKSMPLARLQAKHADPDGTTALVLSVNEALGERAIEPAIVRDAVKTYWPELNAELQKIPAGKTSSARPSVDDMFAEILSLLQTLMRRDATFARTGVPDPFDFLANKLLPSDRRDTLGATMLAKSMRDVARNQLSFLGPVSDIPGAERGDIPVIKASDTLSAEANLTSEAEVSKAPRRRRT